MNGEEGRTRRVLPSSFSTGFLLKVSWLALLDALIIWSIPTLVADEAWFLLGLAVGGGAFLNWAYLSPRTQALKWLAPGLLLMAVFVVWPIIYTAYVALTNWSTGNVLTKEQAIEQLLEIPLESADSVTVQIAVYQDPDGTLAFLVTDPDGISYFGVTRPADAAPLEQPLVPLPDGLTAGDAPDELDGYSKLSLRDLFAIADRLDTLVLDVPGRGVVTAITTSQGALRAAGFRFSYDPESDTLYDAATDTVCVEGVGTFVCDGAPLNEINPTFPGWRTTIGFENFTRVLTNENIRRPFVQVFTWNLIFAAASVVLTFGLGLALANALQDSRLRGKAFYRSVFIIPYAIPAFISTIVWRGLLNNEQGQVNRVLEAVGIDGIPWLLDSTWAKVALLLVNTWLGFPYMFLIATGALQSIPEELKEAARVDGAGPWRVFRSITLPLMLVATAPLLIGSFSFNFNNFVLIFLLTNGGPPVASAGVPLGATDILITFTFDIALRSGRGQNFGLASAIVILIFFIVAFISALSFRATRRLEEVYGE